MWIYEYIYSIINNCITLCVFCMLLRMSLMGFLPLMFTALTLGGVVMQTSCLFLCLFQACPTPPSPPPLQGSSVYRLHSRRTCRPVPERTQLAKDKRCRLFTWWSTQTHKQQQQQVRTWNIWSIWSTSSRFNLIVSLVLICSPAPSSGRI